jgi:hypothetical protein
MSDEYLLICDAEALPDGFFPTVRITKGTVEVVCWRGTFAFPEMSGALIFARQYGETAIYALRSGG